MNSKLLILSIFILFIGSFYPGQVKSGKNKVVTKKLFALLANSGWQLMKALVILESGNLYLFSTFLIAVSKGISDEDVIETFQQLTLFLVCKYGNLTRQFIALSRNMIDRCTEEREKGNIKEFSGCVQLVIQKIGESYPMVARMLSAIVTLSSLSSQIKKQPILNVFKSMQVFSYYYKKAKIKFTNRKGVVYTDKLKSQLDKIDKKLSDTDGRLKSFMEENCFIKTKNGKISNLSETDEANDVTVKLTELKENTKVNLMIMFSQTIDTLVRLAIVAFYNDLGFEYDENKKISKLK